MRRALSLFMLLAMLAAAIPQAGLALSAGEALFGDNVPVQVPMEDPEVADTGLVADDDDIYSGSTATINQYPTLKLGDRDGEDSAAYIVFMQNRLIELGYLRDAADGVFGDNTETAVRMFQRNNGLEETGIADPQTQTKLFSDASTLVRATTDNTVFGSEVSRVQNALALWGFYGGKVDGETGTRTKKAISTFKAYMHEIDPEYGVTPTPEPTPTPNVNGMFNEMPLVMDEPLLTDEGELYDSKIDEPLLEYVDGVEQFQIYRQVVRKGDTGSEALRVQTRLHQLGYLYAADGAYGELSEMAMKYFQRKHGMVETGIADEAAQRLLFSVQAMPGEEYVFPYKVVVDVSKQRVYVGEWNGETFSKLVKTMKCSTGKVDTPTPTGTYQGEGKAAGEWYYFKDFNCYAKWGWRIVGGILFHSVTYTSQKKPVRSAIVNLGHRASHGCVRLAVEDAKWIYDNCPQGTTVVIRD